MSGYMTKVVDNIKRNSLEVSLPFIFAQANIIPDVDVCESIASALAQEV